MTRRLYPLLVLVLGLVLAAPATAAPTRAEYVAAAEPICQANSETNRLILKGVRAKVKKGKYRAAARQFRRAAAAFGQTVNQLAALEKPVTDAATLERWLDYLRLEQGFLGKIAKALKAKRVSQAQGYAIRFSRNANFANGAVGGFGFRYCLLNPSAFA